MHYEQFLFTRNRRQDFTAFVRPARLTNKEVSSIGGIFNYVSDISRLTPDFPSLYGFPLGEYLLLLRHYNSGRQHAGRAIAVIEGIAVPQDDASAFASALPAFVADQANLLNVSASITDVEAASREPSPELEWRGNHPHRPTEAFVAEFLTRRDEDRLFLPFTERGRDLLVNLLADRRIAPTPFFAFGTNADVLAQLEQHAAIELASFFTTERPGYHSRATNRQTGIIAGYEPEAGVEAPADPSMALRSHRIDEMRLRPDAVEAADEESESPSAADSVSIRSAPRHQPLDQEDALEAIVEDDTEPTVLTPRQMRDRLRAEEAAAQAAAESETEPTMRARDPLHWLLDALSSLLSRRS